MTGEQQLQVIEAWLKDQTVTISIQIDVADERILDSSVTNSALDIDMTIIQIVEKLEKAQRTSIPDSLKEQYEYLQEN